jgi:hypothetical protein
MSDEARALLREMQTMAEGLAEHTPSIAALLRRAIAEVEGEAGRREAAFRDGSWWMLSTLRPGEGQPGQHEKDRALVDRCWREFVGAQPEVGDER